MDSVKVKPGFQKQPNRRYMNESFIEKQTLASYIQSFTMSLLLFDGIIAIFCHISMTPVLSLQNDPTENLSYLTLIQ